MPTEAIEVKFKHGGHRANAGAPVKASTLIARRIKDRITEKLNAQIDPIIDAQIEASIGRMKLNRLDIDRYGNVSSSTSETAPSFQSAKLLLEYSIGKPKESLEIKGQVGIVHLIKSLESKSMDEEDIETIEPESDEDDLEATPAELDTNG